jgi:hypothetical protein
MSTTETPQAEATIAQKSWHTATKATAAASDAIPPARAALEAAQEALTAANAEAVQSIVIKSKDPDAARSRIEAARAAVKVAEDDVQWRVLVLHAAEAAHEEAHAAEQQARRAVTVARYEAAHEEWNDENSAENRLLGTLSATVRELVLALDARKDLHKQLALEWAVIPDTEKPKLGGKRIVDDSWRFISELITLPPEVAQCVKSAAEAAAGEVTERRRAARFG